VTSSAVSAYRVYYGTSSRSYQQALGNGVNVGNVTNFAVSGLTKNVTYYFTVTAVDGMGNESPYSNEASKVAQ